MLRLWQLPFVLLVPFVCASAQTPNTPPDTRPNDAAVPTMPQAPDERNAPEAPLTPLVKKIQNELSESYVPPEATADPALPQGEMIDGTINNSAIYPGTEHSFKVYVPAQYDPAKPACLLLRLDGIGQTEALVLDHLIASKEVPVIIAVGISSGAVWIDPSTAEPKKRQVARFNRCVEYDSTNDHYPDFVLQELLPAVQKLKTKNGRAIIISSDPNDRAATGASSGAIGSFTLAWRRPDQFSRVYSVIGTFVPMRGGNEYAPLVRKTEPKPIRIFLEDGSADAWNPLLGSWFAANLALESALNFAGYDVAHAWGTHGHSGKAGAGIFPDVMRWLWRDYPARITAGASRNSTLVSILPDKAGWQKIAQDFQGACGLAANAQGEVYFSDAPAATIYRLGPDGKPAVFLQHASALNGQAFGPDGTLYGASAADKKIVALDARGTVRTIATGIAAQGILVTHDGAIYVSEPGEHTDMPSHLWRLQPAGEKTLLDQGLSAASGIAFSPDGGLFFAAEKTTQWIYSYVVQADGRFVDKQQYYWLHQTDIPDNSGAEDMAVDQKGELYVATNMGVQVCDHNGRVRAILPLPTPCGPVRSICFGGAGFNTLYVTDGKHVFQRKLKVPGVAPWAPPAPYPSEGGG